MCLPWRGSHLVIMLDGSKTELAISATDGHMRRQHEMDARAGDQIGLKLGHIDIQGSINRKRRRQRTNHLSDQTVQVGARGRLNVEVALANITQGLVIQTKGAVRVPQKGMSGKDQVARCFLFRCCCSSSARTHLVCLSINICQMSHVANAAENVVENAVMQWKMQWKMW
jgi:hypothetical protein